MSGTSTASSTAGDDWLTPAWVVESGVQWAAFGASVAPAGDVNADGFDDLIIGAPGAPSDGDFGTGTPSLFLGFTSNVETRTTQP